MDEQERNFIFASISFRMDEQKQIQEKLKKHKSGVEYVYII